MAVADAAGGEMTGGFDPSAFIAAEVSQSVAAPCDTFDAGFATPKTPEIYGSPAPSQRSVATVATVAGGHVKNHPWEADLLPWAESHRPPFIQQEGWNRLVDTALSFSADWGARAIETGWSTLDLFGCYRRPWFRRMDCNGLVASMVGLVTPVRVSAIEPTHVDLVVIQNGDTMRFRPEHRSNFPCSVHLWEAFVMRNGP